MARCQYYRNLKPNTLGGATNINVPDTGGLFEMLVAHYAGKYFNTASLTTIVLQSVKRVFNVSALLIDNILQTTSPFSN